MRRRDFGGLLGGMIASTGWSCRLGAQPRPMPVIGWLNDASRGPTAAYVAAFGEGLGETGFVEGQNVAIEYRWADYQYDRLPELAADLVSRKVDVIVTIGGPATVHAAKKSSSTIPIVFGTGGDPVAMGLIASLARPEGNLTGVSYLVADLGPKRFDLLMQALPQAKVIGLLANPKNTNTERLIREMQEAAGRQGVRLLVAKASTENEIDEAFGLLAGGHAGGVVIQADPFIHSRRAQLLALAARHAIAAIYTWREFAAEGGLISYGPSLRAVYRQVGSYAGRVLKGAKPAELPVVQPTTFELIVNTGTAKALGLSISPSILARADEVIE
jgi:putative ABC transport system substrate-binding protein